MFNGTYMDNLLGGYGFASYGRIIYAPTLTAHDPNPPITIDHAVAAAGDTPQRPTMVQWAVTRSFTW